MPNKKLVGFIIFCIIMMMFGVSRFFMLKGIQAGAIKVLEVKNHKFTRSLFTFTFESPYQDKIVEMAENERLPELVDKAPNEFEKILIIRRWVKHQLETGDFPYPYPPWDASVILDWCRSGKTTAFCGQHAIVFAQALIALNIPVRYLDIARKDREGHFLTEIWSREFKKWIVMDPYFGLHFEKDHLPLSALEMHNALISATYEGIAVVRDNGILYNEYDTKKYIDFYFTFGILFRNDHMSNPAIISSLEDQKNMRRRVIYTEPMLQYSDSVSKSMLVFRHPSSVYLEDFYWEPDLVVIRVADINYGRGEIELEFQNMISDKDFYVYIGTGRMKYKKVDHNYTWKLKEGYNKLYVMNQLYDVDVGEFIQSYIAVEYTP
ncbi:MAG: transglutaminase-like domain-containing protein [bacterium]